MAEILEGFKFRGPGSKGAIYPWDEWLDGKARKLIKGNDFKNSIAVRSVAYREAKKRGLKLHCQYVEGDIVIQAYKNGDGKDTKENQ